jgi:hypothetical protein
MSEIEQLVTTVLAFLDADAAWGAEHPRTCVAKTRLRRVARIVIREERVVDIEPIALDGTAA